MEETKRDLQKIRAKLGAQKKLPWEARRLLRIFVLSSRNSAAPEYREPLSVYYQRGLELFGAELESRNLSERSLYWIIFLASHPFQGGEDNKKVDERVMEILLLARQLSPKTVEQYLMAKGEVDEEAKKEAEELLKALDETLAEPESESEN